MSNKLYVAGVGPGRRDFILPAVEKAVELSDVIIGGKRNLELFSHIKKETLVVGNNLEDICLYIKENIIHKTITVLASGDPGVYGILDFLKKRLCDTEFEVIPGISAFQYLCSKLELSWQDIKIASMHGREENIWDIIRENKKVAVFTGGKSSPNSICGELAKRGLSHIKVAVGENLSYEDERIVEGNPEELSGMSFDSLAIMLLQNENAADSTNVIWNYTTPGIPDEMFIRGQVPMTKEEVRAVTLSKLKLKKNHVVYDIGAGTGSVSIECALNCKSGTVYAIEKEDDAVELIEKNASKFGLDNIRVVHDEAPAALRGLPEPDRVFIGGSSGNMSEILNYVKVLNKAVRVVVNAVAIESVYEALKGFEESGYENIDISFVSVSRGRAAGSKHLMQALNPVYIISAECGGEQ
jgi:precorrin-6B C5,15-methyltransferase / cobalt-precorrin-6B C5,C15-methyltransferase